VQSLYAGPLYVNWHYLQLRLSITNTWEGLILPTSGTVIIPPSYGLCEPGCYYFFGYSIQPSFIHSLSHSNTWENSEHKPSAGRLIHAFGNFCLGTLFKKAFINLTLFAFKNYTNSKFLPPTYLALMAVTTPVSLSLPEETTPRAVLDDILRNLLPSLLCGRILSVTSLYEILLVKERNPNTVFYAASSPRLLLKLHLQPRMAPGLHVLPSLPHLHPLNHSPPSLFTLPILPDLPHS